VNAYANERDMLQRHLAMTERYIAQHLTLIQISSEFASRQRRPGA
jgi:hypothetical protein